MSTPINDLLKKVKIVESSFQSFVKREIDFLQRNMDLATSYLGELFKSELEEILQDFPGYKIAIIPVVYLSADSTAPKYDAEIYVSWHFCAFNEKGQQDQSPLHGKTNDNENFWNKMKIANELGVRMSLSADPDTAKLAAKTLGLTP